MTCKPHAEGTICRTREDLFVDGELYATVGETHYFRDNGWVATHWTNFAPEGYTEDIVATLWPFTLADRVNNPQLHSPVTSPR